MTGSTRRKNEGGRRELPDQKQRQIEAYQKLICEEVMRTHDVRYLKALHLHIKCLKRTLKI